MIPTLSKVFVVRGLMDGPIIKELTVIGICRQDDKYIVGLDRHERDKASRDHVLREDWQQCLIISSAYVFTERDGAERYIISHCLEKASFWSKKAIYHNTQDLRK